MRNILPEHVRRALSMPWLLKNEIKRIFSYPKFYVKLRAAGVVFGSGCKFYGTPIIQRHLQSSIELGSEVVLRSSPTSNPLSPNHPVVLATRDNSASIEIGDACGLTGTTVVSEEQVRIGQRVAVGANVTIVDTDFHPISPERRQTDFLDPQTSSVTIGDDVFIGMNSLILKGVKIGDSSVVGAGSVVTEDIPSKTLAAGNPAKVIREL